uniref:Uncharacterized protein n=1 Tax=Knipowitschia caucasica TaxID=637954 RepID=A0AAV2JTM4_KNICA
MLVQVECKGVLKWVRVPMKEDHYDYFQFIQEVSAKFNLINESDVALKDSSRVDVDADIFDELVRSAAVSFKVFTGESDEGSSLSSVSVESFSSLDSSHGRVPPLNVRVSYALGIVTLFPNLKDKASPTGYEHYYDPRSGQGLINQDFTLLLGEDTSGKFISKWPTFYKPRIISVCKCLRPGPHVDDLLSAQEGSNDYGWDSDLAAILLLVHLLPPTKKGKKFGRISATDATDHVVKFMKVSCSFRDEHDFLPGVGWFQAGPPFVCPFSMRLQ